MSVQMVNAARLRALVGFEDLIEPVSRAFQDFSAGLAQSAILIMYPGSDPALGDAYVKTGFIRGHSYLLSCKSVALVCVEPGTGTTARRLCRGVRFRDWAHRRHFQ